MDIKTITRHYLLKEAFDGFKDDDTMSAKNFHSEGVAETDELGRMVANTLGVSPSLVKNMNEKKYNYGQLYNVVINGEERVYVAFRNEQQAEKGLDDALYENLNASSYDDKWVSEALHTYPNEKELDEALDEVAGNRVNDEGHFYDEDEEPDADGYTYDDYFNMERTFLEDNFEEFLEYFEELYMFGECTSLMDIKAMYNQVGLHYIDLDGGNNKLVARIE